MTFLETVFSEQWGEEGKQGMNFPLMVQREVARARTLHPRPFASAHEAAAIVKEEYDEFWDEVKRKDRNNLAMLKELVHTAAMCQRAAEDLQLMGAE